MNVVGASLLAIIPITNHKPSLAGKLLQKPQAIACRQYRTKKTILRKNKMITMQSLKSYFGMPT